MTEEITPVDRLQAEVTGSKYRSLFVPAASIGNADRMRFIARLKSFGPIFDDGTINVDELSEAEFDKIADFCDFVSKRYTKDEESHKRLESIPFEEYAEAIFEFAGLVGESMGSSDS